MKFLLILAVFLFSPLTARSDELPLSFPWPHHINIVDIPNGEGMEYFYGYWVGQNSANWFVTLQFTPDTMYIKIPTNISANDAKPYRVLKEGSNYALIVYLMEGMTKPYMHYSMLTFSPGRDPKEPYPYLKDFGCSVLDENHFDWPTDKLLKFFYNSSCGRNLPTVSDRTWGPGTYRYTKDNPPKAP